MPLQQIQDPFGLTRLADQMRLNRQEDRQAAIDQQNALTQQLQRKALEQNIQKNEMGLQDLLRKKKLEDGLIQEIQANPDKDPDFVATEYYSKNDPDMANEHLKKIFTLTDSIMKVSPKTAIDLLNKKTGLGVEYSPDKKGDTHILSIPKIGKVYVIDKNTGQTIREMDIPKEEKELTPEQAAFGRLTPEEQKEIIMGKNKNGQEFAPDIQEYYNPDTKKSISVNVRSKENVDMATSMGFAPVTKQQKGYFEETGKIGAKAEEEYVSEITKGRSQTQTLTTMEQLLDRFESGKLAGWEKALQQYGNALGVQIDTNNLSAKEAFDAFSNQLALQSRNLGPGQILAGQMSDKDVQFLKDMNPQLITSKIGNKAIIKIKKAMANRNEEIARMIPEFKKQNNGLFDRSEFEAYVNKKINKKSIFGIPEDAVYAGFDSKTGLPVYVNEESKKKGTGFIPEF